MQYVSLGRGAIVVISRIFITPWQDFFETAANLGDIEFNTGVLYELWDICPKPYRAYAYCGTLAPYIPHLDMVITFSWNPHVA